MAELYKCIGCGAEYVSEKIRRCPDCGYKMFPVPYERKTILIGEIKDFLKGYKLNDILDNDLTYKNKEKDDKRFPDFNTIQGYVTTSKKTELFFERLNQSISNIEKHIHTPFDNAYEVLTENLKMRISLMDEILLSMLKELGFDAGINEVPIPKMKLDYQEIPNDELLEKADVLIEGLKSLSNKLKKFIAVNNVYGDSFKIKDKPFDYKKELTPADILDMEIKNVEKKNKTNYVADIFSDGSDESRDMAKAIWRGIRALMNLPLLTKVYTYCFEDGSIYVNDECKTKLINVLNERYSRIDSLIRENSFDRFDEDKLFELYNKAIELDSFNVLKINPDTLIHVGESEKKLNKLIGLSSIKDSVNKIKAYADRNRNSDDLNLHMVFYGNPGTGKTEVARIIAGILYENKILPTNKVIETDRSGMIGQYVGETPMKVNNSVHQAMGGVLFIDEAYALVADAGHSRFDYGHEAVATLIKAMEDYRGKFCVILAGYKNQMQEMLRTNPGFVSRIQFSLDFPNYSREELEKIGRLMLKNRDYSAPDRVMKKILDITDIKRKDENFANAREMRNILDQVIMCQNLRTTSSDDKGIGMADVDRFIKDAKINLPLDSDDAGHILTADEELDQLVGLGSVKKIMKKIKAYAKRNAGDPDFNLHMRFNGNPGTGKTEVARILSRILYEAGVLSEAKLVETDAFGLMGSVVGETAPKTRAKIADALGGVLFIDEAYALANTASNASYGSEAIAVLLKEMEDKRGQFCTILAGYKDEMNRMIASNPGFESRIQFSVDFPDYSREELGEIASRMLSKKGYQINTEALSRIMDITDHDRQRPNYANARNVRNILDHVILNQNLRVEEEGISDSIITLEDVEDYILEKGINVPKTIENNKERITFDINELKNDYYDFDEEIDTDYIAQSIVSIFDGESQGTGFVISRDGMCLSCAHCIKGDGSNQKARLSLLLTKGKSISVTTSFAVLALDKENDLALIKLQEEMEYYYLPLNSSSYKYKPLSEFVSAGYPLGGEVYKTVSFTEGKIASVNNIDQRTVVFADMFGKPGSSGSPIIDKEKKKVIGVFWGGVSQPGSTDIIPCFTPVDIIWDLLNTIDN